MMPLSVLQPRPRIPRYLVQNQQRSAALIALAYAAIAAAWIMVSDTLMFSVFGAFAKTEELSKLKGLGFVACTSILLYVLIQWLWRRHAGQLTAQLELLRVFVDEAPVAIAMLDGNLRSIAASRRWVRDFKLGGPSPIGRALEEVLPDLPQACKQALQRGLLGEQAQHLFRDRVVAAGHPLQNGEVDRPGQVTQRHQPAVSSPLASREFQADQAK